MNTQYKMPEIHSNYEIMIPCFTQQMSCKNITIENNDSFLYVAHIPSAFMNQTIFDVTACIAKKLDCLSLKSSKFDAKCIIANEIQLGKVIFCLTNRSNNSDSFAVLGVDRIELEDMSNYVIRQNMSDAFIDISFGKELCDLFCKAPYLFLTHTQKPLYVSDAEHALYKIKFDHACGIVFKTMVTFMTPGFVAEWLDSTDLGRNLLMEYAEHQHDMLIQQHVVRMEEHFPTPLNPNPQTLPIPDDKYKNLALPMLPNKLKKVWMVPVNRGQGRLNAEEDSIARDFIKKIALILKTEDHMVVLRCLKEHYGCRCGLHANTVKKRM